MFRGGSRVFEKGWSILGLQAKTKRGGGAGGGPPLGPMSKSLYRGQKRGGADTSLMITLILVLYQRCHAGLETNPMKTEKVYFWHKFRLPEYP